LLTPPVNLETHIADVMSLNPIAERTLEGCVGVDRNSVGNVAVLADPQNGKVRHLGFNPAGCKPNFRNRRAKLQSQGKCRTLRALRRKQSRRTKHEHHIVSKQIVSYAVTHRRVIVVENLEGVRKPLKQDQRRCQPLAVVVLPTDAIHPVQSGFARHTRYRSQSCVYNAELFSMRSEKHSRG
jgi:transposase